MAHDPAVVRPAGDLRQVIDPRLVVVRAFFEDLAPFVLRQVPPRSVLTNRVGTARVASGLPLAVCFATNIAFSAKVAHRALLAAPPKAHLACDGKASTIR